MSHIAFLVDKFLKVNLLQLSIVTILCFTLWVGCEKDEVDNMQLGQGVVFNKLIYKQILNDRKFYSNIRLKAEMKLDDYELYRPMLFAVYDNNSVILLDYADKKLGRFMISDDYSYSFKKIGYGEGRGPGEFLNPVDMKFDNKGSLWILDSNNAKIVILDLEGKLINEIDTERTSSHRLAVFNDEKFVLNSSISSDNKLFNIFSLGNGNQKLFGDKFHDSMFYTEGFISSNNSFLAYTPIGMNFFTVFKNSGQVLYNRKIIEPVNQSMNINMRELPGGHKAESRAEDFIYINSDIQIVEDKVCIMFSGNKASLRSKIIDCYKLQNGDYLKSYKLMNDAIKFQIYNDHLYTVGINDNEFVLNLYIIE